MLCVRAGHKAQKDAFLDPQGLDFKNWTGTAQFTKHPLPVLWTWRKAGAWLEPERALCSLSSVPRHDRSYISHRITLALQTSRAFAKYWITSNYSQVLTFL